MSKDSKRKEDWPGIKLMEWCKALIAEQRKKEWLKFLQSRFQ